MSAHQKLAEENSITNTRMKSAFGTGFKTADEIQTELETDEISSQFNTLTPSSVLPLQITMHFDYIYSIFYSGFLLFTLIFKNNGGLLYPPSVWEVEFASVFFFLLIQIFRLNLGYNAIKTEHIMSMVLFMVFTIFSTIFCIYFSFLTTYVLMIEIAVGVIAIFFGVLEIIMALVAVINGSQRAFASLNTSSLEAALKDPTHLNWNQFFSSTNPKDVAESDPRTVGKLLRVLSHTDDSQQTQAISNAVDEYFRKRFRTLDQEVALEILKDLGSQDSARIPALDSKFWVWETLETAVSQSVMNLNEEDLWKVTKAFYGNAKGSENFQRDFETRYAQLTATF